MGTVLSVARATMPGQMVLRLRRVAADMGELATDTFVYTIQDDFGFESLEATVTVLINGGGGGG